MTSAGAAGKLANAAAAMPGFTGPDAPSPEDMYRCVHCGFCLNVCPTYLETGLETESPRGRIALMKAVHEGRLQITEQVVRHWDLCIQCRACEPACPSGVPYGRLMEAVRVQMKRRARRSAAQRLARRAGFNWLLPNQGRLRALAAAVRLYQRSGARGAVRRSRILKVLPGSLERLDESLPEFDGPAFDARGQIVPAIGPKRARVALLSGCVMPLLHGPTMRAATHVLARNGVEVIVPRGQACCGALNVHAGERERARHMARRNIDVFASQGVDAVVVASAGCGAAMKEYGELLDRDAEYREAANQLAGQTKDIHEFLAELPLIPPEGRLDLRVAYQDACHLAQAQRITAAPRALLRAIPGVELVEMREPEVCCGSGGTYSIFEPEMAQALQRRKVENVLATGADVVASPNPGCVIQLRNGLARAGRQVAVRYVIDLLDEAYSSTR